METFLDGLGYLVVVSILMAPLAFFTIYTLAVILRRRSPNNIFTVRREEKPSARLEFTQEEKRAA